MALTLQDKLNALLESGVATRTTGTWGRGYRDIVILGGKRYQCNGYTVSRILKNKAYELYNINMNAGSKHKKKNYEDERLDQPKTFNDKTIDNIKISLPDIACERAFFLIKKIFMIQN